MTEPGTEPVARHPLTAGVLCAGIAAITAALSYAGTAWLTAALAIVQVVFVLGWLAALNVTGDLGGFVLGAGAAIAADVLAATTHRAQIGRLADVVGVAFGAALLHQLLRRNRRGVTASLAAVLSAVILVTAAASLVGLRTGTGGREAVAVALAGVGAALMVAAVADSVARRPFVRNGGIRGWAGLLSGLVAAAAAGAVFGAGASPLTASAGVRIAVVAAVLAIAADIGVDLAWIGVSPDADDRQRTALMPVSVLLPFAAAAPVAYVAGRVLLS